MTGDVLDLLDASYASAALGAALELGLFALLEASPLTASEISVRLGVPLPRCQYWLQVLAHTGLIDQRDDRFAITDAARTAILDVWRPATWAFLALEARERFPALVDLTLTLQGAPARAALFARPHYVDLMAADADRARRFTRMLYELHVPFAGRLAEIVDARDVRRVLDVGGGSGVVSLALARRHPHLAAVVVDMPNVCTAGREIAAENGLQDRVTYHDADFTRDELPRPFDLAIMCDVGVLTVDVFRRVAAALVPSGRLLVVDAPAPAPGLAPPNRAHWALERSVFEPSFRVPTVEDVEGMLREAGFEARSSRPVETPGSAAQGMVMIEAVCRR